MELKPDFVRQAVILKRMVLKQVFIQDMAMSRMVSKIKLIFVFHMVGAE